MKSTKPNRFLLTETSTQSIQKLEVSSSGSYFQSLESKTLATLLVSKIRNKELQEFLYDKFCLKSPKTPYIDIHILWKKFECSRDVRLGAFYTPSYCQDRILDHIEISEEANYLEPGVGTGNLILALIDKILTELPNLSLEKLLNSLYAFDLDREALELAKLNLILKLQNIYSEKIGLFIYQNIKFYVTDFTVKPPDGFDFLKTYNSVFVDSDTVTHIKKNKKFDYVIGNPPFTAFYGRRSKKLPESHRNYYLSHYDFIPSNVKNGKLNSYMFFVEHGLNLLKEGGHLIYLLDNSIYETAAYHLRKWLLSNFQVSSIQMGIAEFETVASGQTLWHIINNVPTNPGLLENVSQGVYQKINQISWLKNEGCKIDFDSDNSILQKMSQFNAIATYFPKKSIRTCCMLLNLTEKFLVDREAYERDKSGTIAPYLEGSKSLSSPDEPFKFDRYIKYDRELQLQLSEEIRKELEGQGIKNKKRIGLGQLEIYQSPKLFIRQSSHRLIVKFTKELFMANNSLYVLTPIYSSFPIDQWESVLIYTERLLCSKLYLYLAYKLKVIRNNLKQQPQIKVGDLKKLPFWLDCTSSFFSEVVHLSPLDRNTLDKMIYTTFQLTAEEVNEIESFVRSV